MARDITERKKTEEEKLHFEEKIQQLEKLESLGIMAGGVAYDFNNLLMIILGNSEMALMDMTSSAPGKSNILTIESASMRAAELVNQILAYSGKSAVEARALDLSRIIE